MQRDQCLEPSGEVRVGSIKHVEDLRQRQPGAPAVARFRFFPCLETFDDASGGLSGRQALDVDAREHRHQRRKCRLAQNDRDQLALVADRVLPEAGVEFRLRIDGLVLGVIGRIKRQRLGAVHQRLVHPDRDVAAGTDVARMIERGKAFRPQSSVDRLSEREVGAVEADEEVPRSFGVGHSGIPSTLSWRLPEAH